MTLRYCTTLDFLGHYMTQDNLATDEIVSIIYSTATESFPDIEFGPPDDYPAFNAILSKLIFKYSDVFRSARDYTDDSRPSSTPELRSFMAAVAANYTVDTPPRKRHRPNDTEDKETTTASSTTMKPRCAKHGSTTAMAASGAPAETIDQAGNWAPGQGNYMSYLHAANPQQRGVYAKMLTAFNNPDLTPSQTHELLEKQRHTQDK